MAVMNYDQWFAAWRRRNPGYTGSSANANLRDLFWTYRYQAGQPVAGSEARLQEMGVMPRPQQPSPAPPAAGGGQQEPQQPSTPAPPAPPAAPRIDAGRESEIMALVNQRNLLPAEYNSQRNRAATNFRSGLLDSGFFDTVDISSEERTTDASGNPLFTPLEFQSVNNPANPQSQQVRQLVARTPGANEPRPQGNITYKFSFGPDGRIYRQAFMRNADTFAARGVRGSLVSDAQRQSRQSIDTARDQSINNYNNTVETIGRNQGTDTQRLSSAITTGTAGYGQWTGQQDTTMPGGVTPGAAPQDASGTNNVVTPNVPTPPAGNLGSWTVRAAGSNAVPRLTRQVRDRNPGVNFRIVRQGNRYVAVRT